MSNKRDLKRVINYVCRDLFSECVAVMLYGGVTDKSQGEALLSSIINMHSNYVKRISHPEPGMKAQDYFKDLITQFQKEVDETIDQINALNA